MDKKTVLIVEDQVESAAMVEKMINEINPVIECVIATTMKEAFCVLCEKRIDVFLIDIILDVEVEDDVSGLKLAEEIRGIDKYKFTPIIFITSLEDPQLYAYRTLHSYAYIQKPFLVDRTKKTLEEALCYTTKPQKPQTFLFRANGLLFPTKP